MDVEEFRLSAHKMVDWIADYFEKIEQYPVKSKVKPTEIFDQLGAQIPEEGEDMDYIFEDFKNILLKGITHWQHPGFMAYFPANNSFPSILGEFLSAALGTQCMIWETSPAAAELEEKMMDWLKNHTGIPEYFDGVIQDTASTATLTAILTAREKKSDFRINHEGLNHTNYRVYCSVDAHSSVEKAVKIAGLGKINLRLVPTDRSHRMDHFSLDSFIKEDIQKGYQPLCVVAALGTTGTTAIDPLKAIAEICKQHGIWLHVDAAYAGSLLLLEEFRWMIEGIEKVDSIVFNAHKWLFTNFDCSAYFVKDKESLIRTFEILPEYLKTNSRGKVNDYRDWGIPLGRRFRALKLWFVLRNYGLKKIQNILRHHIQLAEMMEKWIEEDPLFEMLAPRTMNLICFRYNDQQLNEEVLNQLNESLMQKINESGYFYLTHTKIGKVYCIRICIGQTHVKQRHVEQLWSMIKSIVSQLKFNY